MRATSAARRMRPDDPPVRVSELLGRVADRLGAGPADAVVAVFSRWDQLVGEAVAAHVRPIRLDGSTLIVVVDHPAWATQIRHLTPEMLTRIQSACGTEKGPERIEIRVRR